MRYIHVGFGSPYTRSYEILQCDKITSSCVARKKRGVMLIVAEAWKVDELFRRVFNAIHIQYIHTYRYSGRVYHVYNYSNELWSLVEGLVDLGYATHIYCRTRECIERIANNVVSNCLNGLEKCLASVQMWVNYIQRVLDRLRDRGRKALYTRFSNRTMRILDKFYEYFPQGFEIPTFRISAIYHSECVNDAHTILKKFFGDSIGGIYANRICRDPSVYLFARGDLFALVPNSMRLKQDNCFIAEHGMQCIFIDDYMENSSYAIFKLVNSEVIGNTVLGIRWVAVLGYDKLSKQVFLHYVPKTLSLHRVETCRKWLLGIVNDFGIERDNYEIIEV